MRKELSMAIVIGLAFVALQGNFGVSAQPYPNKIITGLVGPVAGLNAPVNYSNAVLYLTTQPLGPLVIQNRLNLAPPPPNADFRPDYAQDIGGVNYDWTVADTGMAIFEVRRGMNGYVGINYTNSIKAPLDTNLMQELSAVSVEAYPTLTVTNPSAGQLDIAWTGMQDLNGNIQSYGVWESVNAGGGPYTHIASVAAVPSGAHSYPSPGHPDGSYCYKINVEYKRNVAGTVLNSTVGTSEPSCRTIAVPLAITTTSPVNNAIDVPLTDPIVVTFNRPPASLPAISADVVSSVPQGQTVTTAPSLVGSVLTLDHAGDPYLICHTYKVWINESAVPVPGTNPWIFTAICPNPTITTTVPVDGAVGVSLTADIVITFSKQIDVATYVGSIAPVITLNAPVWSAGDTVATISHAPFAPDAAYTFTVTAADDMGGNPLGAGPVPNPWSWNANSPPTVTVDTPTGGCFARGEVVSIAWTPVDDATPTASLTTTINANDTTSYNQVVDPGPSVANPRLWTPPTTDATNVRINVSATDEAGDSGYGWSAPFDIDVTAPTIETSGPTGAVGYEATLHVYVNFSEAMDTASVEDNITIAPAAAHTYTWSNGDKNLDISVTVVADTAYVVTVGVLSKDTCGAGNTMAAQGTVSFTTGPRKPMAPVLTGTVNSDKQITLAWVAISLFEDGSPITSATTLQYRIYRGAIAIATVPGTQLTYPDTGLTADTQYSYTVRVVANGTTLSAPSNTYTGKTPVAPGGMDWTVIILILIIVIVVVVIIAALLMRKKKPEVTEEAPPEEVPAEEAPPEEAPIEGEAPPEEGAAPPEGETPPEGEGGEESPPPA